MAVPTSKRVILFSQSACPPCQTAKAYLSEKGIAYEDKDVSRDQQAVFALVRPYNSRCTPTFVVGDEVVIGFDRERLEQLLRD